MKIELKLYASFSKLMPQSALSNQGKMEVRSGITVDELLQELEIPDDIPKIVFINGIHATGAESLKEDDRLAVFPPIAGG